MEKVADKNLAFGEFNLDAELRTLRREGAAADGRLHHAGSGIGVKGGGEQLQRAYARGMALSFDQAIDLALPGGLSAT